LTIDMEQVHSPCGSGSLPQGQGYTQYNISINQCVNAATDTLDSGFQVRVLSRE